MTCGITFTFGGVGITENGEVKDTSENVISGLFAAGEITGGSFFNNYPGGSGLMKGAVFGRLAGTSAAAFAKGEPRIGTAHSSFKVKFIVVVRLNVEETHRELANVIKSASLLSSFLSVCSRSRRLVAGP